MAQELGETAQVLRGRGEQHFVPGAVQAPQSKPVRPQDALHMRKSHLNLLAPATIDDHGRRAPAGKPCSTSLLPTRARESLMMAGAGGASWHKLAAGLDRYPDVAAMPRCGRFLNAFARPMDDQWNATTKREQLSPIMHGNYVFIDFSGEGSALITAGSRVAIRHKLQVLQLISVRQLRTAR
jgi:hypothetical protein